MDAVGRANQTPACPRSTKPLASESIALICPLAAKQEKRIRLIGIFSMALLLSRLLCPPARTKRLRPSLV